MKNTVFIRLFGLSVYLEISEKVTPLIYVYAKDDEGYRNLIEDEQCHCYQRGGNVAAPMVESIQCGLYHRLSVDG